MELLEITARDLRMGDELGEGQIVTGMKGPSTREGEWSGAFQVCVMPQEIVWRMHPEIGPFQDYLHHTDGEWRVVHPDDTLRIVRGRLAFPRDRWRPLGCEMLDGQLAPEVEYPIIDPPD